MPMLLVIHFPTFRSHIIFPAIARDATAATVSYRRVPVKGDCHQSVDRCADGGSLQERRRFAHESAIVPP